MKQRKTYLIILLVVFFSSWLNAQNKMPEESKPVIFNFSESIDPGETIGLQGAAFGDEPQVWFAWVRGNEKNLNPQTQLEVLTHSEIYAAAKIPENTPAGLYAVWVRNGRQTSEPVLINRARVMTADFDEIMPGTVFRLFGRNLQQKGGDVQVRFVAPGGSSQKAKIMKSDAFTLELEAPEQLKPGVQYSLLVNNGAGGKFGNHLFDEPITVREKDADPFNLGVPWGADFDFADNVYNVKTDSRLTRHARGDGQANDRAAIQEAIDKAAGSGGGVVYLPQGFYKIEYASGSGITMKSRVILKGEGRDKTVIRYGFGEPFSTERVKAVYGWTLGWPDSRTEGMGLVFPGLITESGLIALSLVNMNESGRFVHTVKNMPEGGSGIVIKDCGFDFNTGWGLALVNIDKLLVTGCRLKSATTDVRGINAPTRTWPWDFKNSRRMLIRDNVYHYNAGRFGANGCHHAVFERNSFVRDGDHQSKGETGGINFDYVTDMVILENSFTVTGAPILPRNQGETILSQGGDPHQMDLGVVTAATETSLTDTKKEWQDFTDRVSTAWQYAVHPTNYTIAIVEGKGTGQWRTITWNNDTVLTVDRAWDVIPEPGSRYVITQWSAWQVLVKDNVLKDNHQGIMFYCGGADVVITGNRLSNSGGIYLRADQRAAMKRYNLLWNTYVSDNEIVNTDGRRAAFVSMLLARGKDEKLLGTGCIGLEVRRNLVQASVPNMTKSPIKQEGFLNCMNDAIVQTPVFDPKIPGILGTIFQNNKAVYTDVAFQTGAGAHHTIILQNKLENVPVPLKDMVNEKTKTGAQFTVKDLDRH
ncbi:MAG: glycosyl hydrolase family 28-related protein [Mangrovibacterium sp.]